MSIDEEIKEAPTDEEIEKAVKALDEAARDQVDLDLSEVNLEE